MALNSLALLAGLGHTLWGRSLDAFDVTNGLFGSIVAVTGDAHQAQVAQDIFRQEVRIERSLRVREDIRDAHKLMIENVQTQLLMGNIVLGICFAVLIEGRPSDPQAAPVIVQELWGVFSFWSVSLSFLAVWFSLQFQEVVSVSARKRLLEKHRVCTPNDEVVGRMGGLSLAEKVSQLHQRGLNELVRILSSTTGCGSVQEALARQVAALGESIADLSNDLTGEKSLAVLHGDATATDSMPGRERSEPLMRGHASFSTSMMDVRSMGNSLTNSEAYRLDEDEPSLDILVCMDGTWKAPPSKWRRPERRAGEFECVRAVRGVRAWFSETGDGLLDHHIVDLPDFLIDETLVRCGWRLPAKGRRSVRLMVRGAATLYVAAQWPAMDKAETFRSQGPPAWWSDSEMPVLYGSSSPFERVEGFSILVSERKLELPIYRAALEAPDSSGWRKIKLQFKFDDDFEAPILILRRGMVLTSEEDWPVRDFLNELDEIQPLREHSMKYMNYGLMNLLLAAFFAHLGRVLTDRPWPQCQREVVMIGAALLPALIFASNPNGILRHMFNVDPSLNPRLGKKVLAVKGMPQSNADGHDLPGGLEATQSVMGESIIPLTPPASPSRGAARRTPTNGQAPLREASTESGALAALAFGVASPRSVLDMFPDENDSTGSNDSDAFLCCGLSPAPAQSSRSRGLPLGADEPPMTPPKKRSPQALEVLGEETPVTPLRKHPPELEAMGEGAVVLSVQPSPMNPKGEAEKTSETSADQRGGGDEDVPRRIDSNSPDCGPASSTATSEVDSSAHHFRRPYLPMLGPIDAERARVPRRRRRPRCCHGCSVRLGRVWRHLTRLNMLRHVVYVFWVASIIWVVGGHLARGGAGDDEAAEVARLQCTLDSVWTAHEASWPSAFFMPTAAALAPDGTLWVAADWLLVALPSPGTVASSAATTSLRLPTAAMGLLVPGNGSGRLLVAGRGLLHALDVGNVSSGSPAPGPAGPIGGVAATGAAVAVVGTPIGLPQAQLGTVAAIASAALPGAGPTLDVVAVAPVAGGVYLCAAQDLLEGAAAANGTTGSTGGANATLEVAAHMPHRSTASGAGGSVAAVGALHLCTAAGGCGAGEPVLWAVDTEGCLAATGLESGKVLGSWLWLAATAGGSPAALALTGNATHLVAVAQCRAGVAPVVLSAPYAALLEVGARSPCGR